MDFPQIREYTIVSDTVQLGENTVIWHFTNVQGLVTIGADCVIGSHCCILGVGQSVIIGDNVRIQSHCFIPGGTKIGNNVFVAPGVTILNDKYPPTNTPKDWKPVTISDNVVIGGGAVLVPGITIGSYAKIGAGAIVTKDVNPYDVVVGNPAKPAIQHQWHSF